MADASTQFLDSYAAEAKRIAGVAADPRGALEQAAARQLAEWRAQVTADARQSAANTFAAAGVPPNVSAGILNAAEDVISGRPVDADALARATVVGVATGACAAFVVTAPVAPLCGVIAGAVYGPVRDGFIKAFGGKTKKELDEERRQNALKDDAERFRLAAMAAHAQKLTALAAFLQEGMRLYGARVTGSGKDATLWYADPRAVALDPFRTDISKLPAFEQKQQAQLQLSFVNRFLKDSGIAVDLPFLRDGDLTLADVSETLSSSGATVYNLRNPVTYIKPAWRLLLVGDFPPWLANLRGEGLRTYARVMAAAIGQRTAVTGEAWSVCSPGPALLYDARSNSVPGGTGSKAEPSPACASALWICRKSGTDVQCAPHSYGRTVHPKGNSVDSVFLPTALPPQPTIVGGFNNPNYANQVAAWEALRTTQAPRLLSDNANAVTRNARAAAVQAGQLQAILEKGAAAIRQLAEDRGKQLAEVQRQGYIQAATSAEGRATTAEGRALTAEERAKEAEASAARLKWLLAAAAVGGAVWWWSARKGKR